MATSGARAMTGREWLLLAILSVLWGGSFFFNSVVVTQIPPFTAVLGRVALAAAVLWPVMMVRGLSMPRGAAVWGSLMVAGAISCAVPFSLIVWGQNYIPSGLAAILNASMPLFTVIFAHFLTNDEKLTASRLIGVMIGFCGILVLMSGRFEGWDRHLLASLAVLLSGVSYALGGIFGRRFAPMGLVPIVAAYGQLLCAGLILMPLVLWVDRPWHLPVPSRDVLAAWSALAVFSTAAAYIIFFRVLAGAGAGNVALVTFMIPLSALILGVLFRGEQIAWQHLAGFLCIILGFSVIDGRLWRVFRQR